MTREQILCLPIPENCCCEEHEACDAPDITPTGHGEIFVSDETCRVGGNARPTACPGCPAHKGVTTAALAKPRWAMLEVESVAGTDDGDPVALPVYTYDKAADSIAAPSSADGGDPASCPACGAEIGICTICKASYVLCQDGPDFGYCARCA